MVEDREHEFIQRWVSILALNLLDELRGRLCSKGVQLQQSVSSLFQSRGQSYTGGDGFLDQPGQFGAGGQYYAFQKGVNILQPAQGTFTDQRSRNIFYQPGFQN